MLIFRHIHLWLWSIMLLCLAACSDNTATVALSPTTAVTAVPTFLANGTAAPSAIATADAPAATTPPASTTGTPVVDTAVLQAQVQPLLGQLWQTYKSRYMQGDGRVADPLRANASTSEGLAYAALRAVWQNDRTTFDAVVRWADNNLQLPRGDKLFAYLWGKKPDNTWAVLDTSAATDADGDMAYALALAADTWHDPRYQTMAQAIIGDMWRKEVVTINGQPYLTAGDWSPPQAQPALNPSYLAPYEYRLFAHIDPDNTHNWNAVVDTAYAVITHCTTAPLDSPAGVLPPNWCAIDKKSGGFISAHAAGYGLDSDYGYDAFRTLWRLALDYRWYGDSRALSYLQSLTVLQQAWTQPQRINAIYSHDGQPKDTTQDLGIYSGSLGLFMTVAPAQADQIVSAKLLPRLQNIGHDDPDPAHADSGTGRTYYAQNWLWFGLALYANALPKPALR